MLFPFGRGTQLLMASMVVACSKPLGPLPSWRGGPVLDTNQVIRTNATVRFVDIEGGCWILQTPGGDYEPANLPARYRVNGQGVHVVFRGSRMGSFCMVAPVVTLDSVRAP